MGVIPETATEMEVARALLEAASIRMSRDDIPTISVISTCVNNDNNNDDNKNNNKEEKTKVENLESSPSDGNPRLKQNNEEVLTVKDYWRERSAGRRTTLPSLLSSLAFGTSELEDAPRLRSNTWGSEAKRILAPLVKAASSKDVEEAMAGGLSRTEIFIPPL